MSNIDRRSFLLSSLGAFIAPQETVKNAKSPTRWAVIIGVDSYENSEVIKLQGAGNDAIALANLFQEKGYNILLFVNPEKAQKFVPRPGIDDSVQRPTLSKVLDGISSLKKRVAPGDFILTFFAGHGCEDVNSEDGYMFLYETLTTDLDAFRRTALNLKELESPMYSLRREKSVQVVIIYDMCRVDMDFGNRNARLPMMTKKLQDGGRGAFDFSEPVPAIAGIRPVFLSWWSCNEGEKSYEAEQWIDGKKIYRGYFSYHLEKVLRDSGALPLPKLVETVGRSVAVAAQKAGKVQNPHFIPKAGWPSSTPLIDGEVRGIVPISNIPIPVQPTARVEWRDLPVNATVRIDDKLIRGTYSTSISAKNALRKVTLSLIVPEYLPHSEMIDLRPGNIVLNVPKLIRREDVERRTQERFGEAIQRAQSKGFPELAKYLEQLCEVPVGPFFQGSESFASEQPKRSVMLSQFWIGQCPVTVSLWREYARAKRANVMPGELPRPNRTKAKENVPPFNPKWSLTDHPIVNVPWSAIYSEERRLSFCTWASEVTGLEITLPSESQWEKAARGPDGREFPWEGEFSRRNLWCSRNTKTDAAGTCAVGRYPSGASPYGCLDMVGNVWEWCLDFFAEDSYSEAMGDAAVDPINLEHGPRVKRVVRGGSWVEMDKGMFRCSQRLSDTPTMASVNTGFRLVVTPSKSD